MWQLTCAANYRFVVSKKEQTWFSWGFFFIFLSVAWKVGGPTDWQAVKAQLKFLWETTSTELSDPGRSTGALRLTRRRLARLQFIRFEPPDAPMCVYLCLLGGDWSGIGLESSDTGAQSFFLAFLVPLSFLMHVSSQWLHCTLNHVNPVQSGNASDVHLPTNVTVNSHFLSTDSCNSATCTLVFHFLLFGPVRRKLMRVSVCECEHLRDSLFTPKRLQICGKTYSHSMNWWTPFWKFSTQMKTALIYFKILSRPSEPACLVERTPA